MNKEEKPAWITKYQIMMKDEVKELLKKKMICPNCNEEDTMLWCCECLRKYGIKTAKAIFKDLEYFADEDRDVPMMMAWEDFNKLKKKWCEE